MIKSFNTPAMQARRAQAGITLIEVSIGLIIAAIIAAAAFIAFQNNARRSEVQDNSRQITEIISETKQKFGLTTGYEGLTNDLAIQAAILPSILEGENLVPANNSYGGAITLAGVDANTATLTWADVEGDQCTDIVLSVADGVTDIEGLDAVEILNGQITLENATTICGDGGVATPLVFTFGRR